MIYNYDTIIRVCRIVQTNKANSLAIQTLVYYILSSNIQRFEEQRYGKETRIKEAKKGILFSFENCCLPD